MTQAQEEQRRYALAVSGGVCEACGKPLADGQPQGAHRIGNTRANRARYGSLVVDHRYNIGYTCSLACNGKLDISGDTGACVRLCARIYAAEARKYGTERRRQHGGGKKKDIERYISEFDKKAEKAFDDYQETGSPSYERTHRKYSDLAEALRVALENDDDRNCDRARRARNIKDYAERLADKTYTKDEVKDMLLEVAYWM